MLWQYMKSGNPYNVKLFLTHISVLVAQIKKLKKADWHFFGQVGLAVTFPTQIQIHKYTNTQIHKYSGTETDTIGPNSSKSA